MNRNTFWSIIDEARKTVDDVFEVASAVTEKLNELSADEIVSFKQHQYDLMAESYRRDIWAVGYIINGGCSDDGFDYFRAWLMANGRERWEAAMKNPEAIGDLADPEEAEDQEMLYVPDDAYRDTTGEEEFPENRITVSTRSEPVGEPWEEDHLKTMYPKLCETFS